MKRYLRRMSVLAKFGIGNSTLYEWITDHGFPPSTRIGNVALWDEHELDAWFEAHKAKAAEDVAKGGAV